MKIFFKYSDGLTKLLLTFFVVCLLGQKVSADSPLTSTDFAEAYLDQPIVAKARQQGIVDLEIARYLSDPENTTDSKAAVVNALGWNIKGKKNAQIYRSFLASFYDTTPQKLVLDRLSADELFGLGYLTALDDYFNTKPALPILAKAKLHNRDSYTVSVIHALAVAQNSRNFCLAWQAIAPLRFTGTLKVELRRTARAIIWEYMNIYEKYC